ncbi:hypothetical protein [Serratia odorifera]|uniref:Unspecific monooxygenase n=2 Tax=Serratia odorifera TaxID=618 RepID=D4E8W5_SEROD|nr:hypothetical protein [Serratia odorifera]EFE93731.1 hypothetical protein HMPREF0758_4615 [Serratia odorifera DSM 4582]PNK88651.1 cytochrome P450 [Serratia odorifera]RII69554.1 cytochrome P450 [Serratia odorifera]VDZ65276.1 Uncharacterised protein [Serratia odorifera]
MSHCPFHLTDAQRVQAALSHAELTVRPWQQPVPLPLIDTPAQSIFAAMVRMRDGEVHRGLKMAVSQVLADISAQQIEQLTRHVAQQLAPQMPDAEALTRFNYALPVCVLGLALGIEPPHWVALVDEVLDFVRCIAPGGTPAQMASGAVAAGRLYQRVSQGQGPLCVALLNRCRQYGSDRHSALANAVGLLFQACEGTAGLMGLALLAGAATVVNAETAIEQVLRDTPPIQNTRRFAGRDGAWLAGQWLAAGQSVRVPLYTPQASFAFGHGAHRCPGEGWATIIALNGLHHLAALEIDRRLLLHVRWRESQNARVAEFYTLEEQP